LETIRKEAQKYARGQQDFGVSRLRGKNLTDLNAGENRAVKLHRRTREFDFAFDVIHHAGAGGNDGLRPC
jgi:hypothetical protein